MNEITHIKERNVDVFLRRFAKSFLPQDLELIHHPWGRNLVFYYRGDSVLKVAKRPGGRLDLLKEAAVLTYLSHQDLPVAVPKPLLVHDKGYYLLLSRIDGDELDIKTLAKFAPDRRDAFARSIGAFLSFLHTHEFPQDVITRVPQAPENLRTAFERAERKVAVLKKFTECPDIPAWEEKLNRFRGILHDKPTLTHGDFYLKHVFSVRGGTKRFAVIDFNFAMFSDPAIDFSELVQSLSGPGVPSGHIHEKMLANYLTNDAEIAHKIDFILSCGGINEIYKAFQRALN